MKIGATELRLIEAVPPNSASAFGRIAGLVCHCICNRFLCVGFLFILCYVVIPRDMATFTVSEMVFNESCIVDASRTPLPPVTRYSVASGMHGARCYLPLSAFNAAAAKSFIDVCVVVTLCGAY